MSALFQSLHDFYAMCGAGLAIGFSAILLAGFLRIGIGRTVGIGFAAIAVAMLVPIIWSPAFVFVRSALGPLSAGFFVLCGYSGVALALRRPAATERDEAYFTTVYAVVGSLLVVSALGYLPFDIYALGYDWPLVFAIISVILAGALYMRSTMTAIWVGLGSGLSMTGLTDSLNLWDCFVDPIACITSVILAAAHLAGRAGMPWPYFGYRMSSRPAAQRGDA